MSQTEPGGEAGLTSRPGRTSTTASISPARQREPKTRRRYFQIEVMPVSKSILTRKGAHFPLTASLLTSTRNALNWGFLRLEGLS